MPYVTNNILREKFEITFGFIFNHPLGKRHPFRALTRFIYWQCQTLFCPSKFFIKSFVKPVNFYVKKGLYGITTNIYIGLHEFYDMSFYCIFCVKGICLLISGPIQVPIPSWHQVFVKRKL